METQKLSASNGNTAGNQVETVSLKALARKVLRGNRTGNFMETSKETGGNFKGENRAKVSMQFPVVSAGRTFRRCAKCGKQGWHPEASAEICCGQSMVLIEHPAMTVSEYVRFIHCPKSYASGAISKADVLDMMKKDGVQQKAVTGGVVAPI